jgi:predicted membrane-bound dolichyl-phosphate-mannose-protein mannosyltransferase
MELSFRLRRNLMDIYIDFFSRDHMELHMNYRVIWSSMEVLCCSIEVQTVP